jgi:hypothetical protein
MATNPIKSTVVDNENFSVYFSVFVRKVFYIEIFNNKTKIESHRAPPKGD